MSIQELKNRHAGERCFILGSGPSIAQTELSPLIPEISFASNWFVNHEDFQRLNIDYYCAYDEAFVQPEINPVWRDRLRDIAGIKFFPEAWRNLSGLPEARYLPYDPTVKVYQSGSFSDDPARAVYDAGTVVINFCLPLAFYMGCTEIVLLGVETDYRIGARGDQQQAYFYNIDRQHTPNTHTAQSERRWVENTLQAYAVVARHARRRGVRIVNATPGGRLELYPRVPLPRVLKRETT